MHFYKIINESVYFPWFSIMPLPSSSIRHCHPHSFKTPFARCNGLKYSFVHLSVHLWNNLPLEAVSSADLRAFKFSMYHLCSCIHSCCCCFLLYHTVWVTFVLASSYLVFPCIIIAEFIIEKTTTKNKQKICDSVSPL